MSRYFLVALVVVGLALLSRSVRTVEAEQGPLPFTAVQTNKVFKYPEGTLHQTLTFELAYRSDGSHARWRTVEAPDGKPARVARVTDLKLKKAVSFDELTESTTTTRLTDWLVERMAKPANACIGLNSSAEQAERLGYRIFKVIHQLPQEESGMRMSAERWLAPELNCLPLLEATSYIKDGKSTIVNQTEIVLIQPGEPAPDYFNVLTCPLDPHIA